MLRLTLTLASAASLFLTAIVKIASVTDVTGNATSRSDLVVPWFSLKTVLLASSACELIVGLLLLTKISSKVKGTSLLWLSSVFLLYRLGLYLNGVKSCNCMGKLASWTGLTPSQVETTALMMLVLFVFSGTLLLYGRSAEPKDVQGVG